jgi:hypothetical protein
MSIPSSRKALISLLDAAPQNVQYYFDGMPSLIQNYPLEVALAYAFSRVETAQLMTLYCGVVKVHRAASGPAWRSIGEYHLTRGGFRNQFEIVFGRKLPEPLLKKLGEAESTRDKVLHGKWASERDKRGAIAGVIEYAIAINALTKALAGFQPFGDLRGFKGRAGALDASTTRWLLKGMGFPA